MGFFSRLFSGEKTTSLPSSPPRTVRDLLPVSLYCNKNSFDLTVNSYNNIYANAGNEKVTHLNSLVKETSYWGEVFPFISGPFWGLLTRPISTDEADLIPRIGLNFLYDSSLGMMISKSGDLIFLNIKPTRRSGIFFPGATIDTGIDIRFAKAQMGRNGWKTERF